MSGPVLRYGFLPGGRTYGPARQHIVDKDGRCICGAAGQAAPGATVSWDNLTWFPLCERCREKAYLLLRPKASFWYLSPFNGEMKTFGSLGSARAAAKREHGTSTIHQSGPGSVNKIVEFVEGLDPLP